MLKPANPNFPQNETAAREATSVAPAETRDHVSPPEPGVMRLHDKPDDRSDASQPDHRPGANQPDDRPDTNQPNRAYAQTVRGQVQRVRLDLLARENERLDRQIQQLVEQQKEQSDKDRLWRQHWETQTEQERQQLEQERRLRAQEQKQREQDLQMLEQERRLREQEQMRHARQLQKIEQERQLHKQERQESKHLEARLQELGAQVDRLNSDLARQVEAVASAKPDAGLRDTVKPLLLAVIEMLGDSDQVPADAAAALLKAHGTGRDQADTPSGTGAEPQSAVAQATPLPRELSGPARPLDTGRKPEADGARPGADLASRPPAPGAQSIDHLASAAKTEGSAASSPGSFGSSSEAMARPAPSTTPPTGTPAAAKTASLPERKAGVPAGGRSSDIILSQPANLLSAAAGVKPETLPESLDEDISFAPEKSSLDDEVAIEIARLLRPQDSEQDSEALSLNPEPAEKTEPEPAASQTEAAGAPLLLGTSQTPALDAAPVTPPATTAGPPETAAPKIPATPVAEHGSAGKTAPPEPVEAAALAPDEPGKPAAPETTPGKSAVAPPASAPRPVPAEAMEREPLPKCLTERWDDQESSGTVGGSSPLDDPRRDRSSFRWPFRRLRSTIEHDQAMEAMEKNGSRTPDGSTGSRPAGRDKPTR